MQLWPWMKVNIIELRKDYIDLSLDCVRSKFNEHGLNSFWNNWTFIIFTVKICMTLNEGQGQYSWHVMHSHVWGSHCDKLDGNDFNSFRGIGCEGQTHTNRQPHTHTLRSTLKFANIAYDFPNNKGNTKNPISRKMSTEISGNYSEDWAGQKEKTGATHTRQNKKRADRKMESNDSPEISVFPWKNGCFNQAINQHHNTYTSRKSNHCHYHHTIAFTCQVKRSIAGLIKFAAVICVTVSGRLNQIIILETIWTRTQMVFPTLTVSHSSCLRKTCMIK